MSSQPRHAARTRNQTALPAGRAPLPVGMAPAAERRSVRRLARCLLAAICIAVASRDILAAVPVWVDESVKRTTADLLAAGTAIEAHFVDNASYPEASLGLLETVRSSVEPAYIGELPVIDAWGNPILYCSSGSTFLLWSFGSDGEPDDPPIGGSTDWVGADIILANKDLWQAPKGFCCVGPWAVSNPFLQIQEECPSISVKPPN